jgi:hypothetical protein
MAQRLFGDNEGLSYDQRGTCCYSLEDLDLKTYINSSCSPIAEHCRQVIIKLYSVFVKDHFACAQRDFDKLTLWLIIWRRGYCTGVRRYLQTCASGTP